MLSLLKPNEDYFTSYQLAVDFCKDRKQLPNQYIVESGKKFFVELTNPTLHKHEKLRAVYLYGEKYTKKENDKNQLKIEL